MMKNTNNIRLVLQQANVKSLQAYDFVFRITDDNSLMDKENAIVRNGLVTYKPWET